jgi:hypothetical protein
MNQINAVGLVICLLGITLHVALKVQGKKINFLCKMLSELYVIDVTIAGCKNSS